jgi:ParB-like chromosome segregation protein Spo0J
MVPVKQLWDNYWIRVWGENVAEFLLNGGAFEKLGESIEREGLRAPLLVHKNGSLRGGSHRLMAIKRLGWKRVESFVTNTTGGTL